MSGRNYRKNKKKNSSAFRPISPIIPHDINRRQPRRPRTSPIHVKSPATVSASPAPFLTITAIRKVKHMTMIFSMLNIY